MSANDASRAAAAKVRRTYGQRTAQELLNFIATHPRFTPREMEQALYISGNTITRHLKSLRDSGKVVSDRGMYQLKEQSCN